MLYQYSLMLSKKIFTAVRNFLSPSTTLPVTNVKTLVQILCDIKCENAVEFNACFRDESTEEGEGRIISLASDF